MNLRLKFNLFVIALLIGLEVGNFVDAKAQKSLEVQDLIENCELEANKVLLARQKLLEFVQFRIDLIKTYRFVYDQLQLLHDLKLTSGGKFSLKKLFTTREWNKAVAVLELEKTEDAFIKDLLEKSSFLINDNISESDLLSELYEFDQQITDFCNTVGISVKKVCGTESLDSLFLNIENKIKKIRYQIDKINDDPTFIGRLKKVFWGSNFSYNFLPVLIELGAPALVYTKNKISIENDFEPFVSSKSGESTLDEMASRITMFNKQIKKAKKTAIGITKDNFYNIAGTFAGNIYKNSQYESYEDNRWRKRERQKQAQKYLKKKTLDKNGSFDKIIGYEKEKAMLKPVVEALVNPLKFKRFGINVPRGVLFAGQPGTGKTLFAQAIAGEAGCACWECSASDLVGEHSKEKIDSLFRQAEESAPSIIFIDEIDFIGGRKDKVKQDSSRSNALANLLTVLNGFKPRNPYRPVLVVAATNCPDDLDEALVRSGRFDIRISLGLPDNVSRRLLLEKELSTSPFNEQKSVNIDDLVRFTDGCSCPDILTIINQARSSAFIKGMGSFTLQEFKDAAADVTSKDFLIK